MQLAGVHHLTAVSADAPGNHRFYTGVMGMRLVKKTVNQDDIGAYHLFYADALASPGSDLTFFEWPVPRERRGGASVTRIGLRVTGPESLAFWTERLRAAGIETRPVDERDGRLTLDFEDPEGQRLALVADGGAGDAHPWEGSPVPAEHQIRGLGPIAMSVHDIRNTDIALTRVLNMERVRAYPDPTSRAHTVHVYQMGEGGPAAELHVAERPDLPMVQPGAGGVHHVAFRTPDEQGYAYWADRLRQIGVPNSGPVDRFWFRSLYFREPGGVLIEIATDGPGFTTDEPIDRLGETLSLPPFLEPRRAAIEAELKPL